MNHNASCFISQTKSDKNVGFSHLDNLTSNQIALRVIGLLPSLCEHLEATSGFFQVNYKSHLTTYIFFSFFFSTSLITIFLVQLCMFIVVSHSKTCSPLHC